MLLSPFRHGLASLLLTVFGCNGVFCSAVRVLALSCSPCTAVLLAAFGCFQNRRGPTHRARQGARLRFHLVPLVPLVFLLFQRHFSMLVPGTASSPSDVSKVLDMFSLVMVRQDRGFDPNLVDLFSCRFLRNDRDEFSVSFRASFRTNGLSCLHLLSLYFVTRGYRNAKSYKLLIAYSILGSQMVFEK